MLLLLLSLFSVEATLGSAPSDPFFAVELYAFRVALLILFMVGLYRLLRHEIKK